jgi:hypothetical protein
VILETIGSVGTNGGIAEVSTLNMHKEENWTTVEAALATFDSSY